MWYSKFCFAHLASYLHQIERESRGESRPGTLQNRSGRLSTSSQFPPSPRHFSFGLRRPELILTSMLLKHNNTMPPNVHDNPENRHHRLFVCYSWRRCFVAEDVDEERRRGWRKGIFHSLSNNSCHCGITKAFATLGESRLQQYPKCKLCQLESMNEYKAK